MTTKQDIKQLLWTVSDYFGIPPEELTNKRRDKKTALARHVAIYLLREGYSCSLSEIGRELGNRNHATVLHGYEKIASALSTNPHLSDQIAEIRERLSLQRGYNKAQRSV